jgi:hypothetical protein
MKISTAVTIVGFGAALGAIYAMQPEVTQVQLIDAGVISKPCAETYVACDSITGKAYHRKVYAALDCRDGGHGFILKSGSDTVMPNTCDLAPSGAPPPTELPFLCACRKKGGTCNISLPDGGIIAAPYGQTLQPGWYGSGCVPKACVEMFGTSSWNPSCK